MGNEDRGSKMDKALRFALKRLEECGCTFKTIDDGGEVDEWIDVKEKTRKEILEDLRAVDDAQLLIENPEGKEKWIRFIFANDPNEIFCDYHSDSTIDKVAEEVYDRTY